jgi:3-deoxy-D-manno-octulosonic-acid transferase
MKVIAPLFRWILLGVYTLFYTLFLILALPGYLIKMKRRGGFGTGLLERFGWYRPTVEEEPKGGLFIHAVSVGEVMIALKLVRAWLKSEEGPVVLSTSTSTGWMTAKNANLERVRVVYSPLDLPGLPGRCLDRFQPELIALTEAELWPMFANAARRRGIPMAMINARLSFRSEKRYHLVRPLVRWLFAHLDAMGVQDSEDARRFVGIGVSSDIIHVTGSIKFDQEGSQAPKRRSEFQEVLDALRQDKPVVLAASTHAGEETLIARAIHKAGGFPLIVPRHAERRQEVMRSLQDDGWLCVLRSQGHIPKSLRDKVCYVADTTGELRDWTAHAQVVVIGKSFLAEGGQNPAEAVAASVPVVTGPHMENFDAFMKLLTGVSGVKQCDAEQLPHVLKSFLDSPLEAHAQASRALVALKAHYGATRRTMKMLADVLSKDAE